MRGNIGVKPLDLRRNRGIFGGVVARCGKLLGKIFQLFHRRQLGGKHAKHFLINGVPADVPSVLFKIAYARAVLFDNLPALCLRLARDKADKRGLALAVSAYQTDALALVQRKIDVVEY